jgi:hypothetical protein
MSSSCIDCGTAGEGFVNRRQFTNDDGCGDATVDYGLELRFQTWNVLTGLCFLNAGIQVLRKAQHTGAQAYGFMLCLVAIGSMSFHSTATMTGFLIDIVPMAVSGGQLVHAAINVLQLDANMRGQKVELLRFCGSAGISAFAVWVPWMMIESGFSAEAVWGVWAILFGSTGAIFGVVALLVFREYPDPRRTVYCDVAVAVASILLGLGTTVHSFIPGLCSGLVATFGDLPFHAIWHVCSSISAYKCGMLLDKVVSLCKSLEARNAAIASGAASPIRRKKAPLIVRMIKDALPSQFSM